MVDFRSLAENVDRMDIDCAFTISRDGEVVSVSDLVPCVYHSEETDIGIDSPGWIGAIRGFTGQWLYRGHVMHPSEHVGEALAEALYGMGDGVVFAVVAVGVLPESDEEELDFCGWTILRKA